MVGPIINVGTAGNSRYTVDFSPLARGYADMGRGLGQGFAAFGQGIGQQREKDRRKQARMGLLDLSGDDSNSVLRYAFENDLVGDPASDALLGRLLKPKGLPELRSFRMQDGSIRTFDAGSPEARQARSQGAVLLDSVSAGDFGTDTPSFADRYGQGDIGQFNAAVDQGHFSGSFEDWGRRNQTGGDGADQWTIQELADGRKYYVHKSGQQEPRLVNPGLDVPPPAPDVPATLTERDREYLLNPASDTGSARYAAVYKALADPKTFKDEASGQYFTIKPDMSAYRAPTFAGHGAGTATTLDTAATDAGRPGAIGGVPPGGRQPPGQPGAGATATGTPGAGDATVTRYGQGRFTEQQARAAQTAQMVGEGLQSLSGRGPNGRPLFEALASATDSIASGVPLAGNYLVSEEYQQGQNALRNVVASILRLETGAAATEFEVEDLLQRYAPRPGDTAATIRQKWDGIIGRWKQAEGLAGPAYKNQFPNGFDVPTATDLFADTQGATRLPVSDVVGGAGTVAPEASGVSGAPTLPADLTGLDNAGLQSFADAAKADPAVFSSADLDRLEAEWDRRNSSAGNGQGTGQGNGQAFDVAALASQIEADPSQLALADDLTTEQAAELANELRRRAAAMRAAQTAASASRSNPAAGGPDGDPSWFGKLWESVF